MGKRRDALGRAPRQVAAARRGSASDRGVTQRQLDTPAHHHPGPHHWQSASQGLAIVAGINNTVLDSDSSGRCSDAGAPCLSRQEGAAPYALTRSTLVPQGASTHVLISIESP